MARNANLQSDEVEVSDALQLPGDGPAPVSKPVPPVATTRSRVRRLLLVAVALIAVAALGISLPGHPPGASEWEARAEGETWFCPMHRDYKSDKPGNCPICSMKLLKEEEAAGAQSGAPGPMPAMPGMEHPSGEAAQPAPGGEAVFIDPRQQQLIGIQFAAAELKQIDKEIRAVGKVAYDETRVAHIHTKFSGYIEEVYADYVGKAVRKGDPLFTVYSPDLVSTQEEFLLAVRARRDLSKSAFQEISGGARALADSARKRLELWDISKAEIDALEREGKAIRALTIHSPVNGVVVERAAYHHGRYVEPNMDIYTIVDLSSVWILGEVYEYELPLVKVGQMAEIELPYATGQKHLRGRVRYIYPTLNEKTRTGMVRFEFPNPDSSLKPGMFVNVRLKVSLGERLVVPEDAVLNSGIDQYVFVDKGSGYFEPRPVKAGVEADGNFVIESGLAPGERVVTAANFIVDSESRLKGAFAGMAKRSGEQPALATEPGAKIAVLEPKTASTGRNTLRVRVADASGAPVTDGAVEVVLFMPQMGSMAPMTLKSVLGHVGSGEYVGEIDIPMAYSWQTTITARRGDQIVGSLRTTLTAR